MLFGETREELGGSEYLAVVHKRKAGEPPRVDLNAERALQQLMVEAASHGLIKSAHDCSDGGLAVALAESCIVDGDHLIGARVDVSHVAGRMSLRSDALLFGESTGRIIISCARHHVEMLETLAQRHGVRAVLIGKVGGARLTIDPWIEESVDVLSDAWRSGLPKALGVQGSGLGVLAQSPEPRTPNTLKHGRLG